MKYLLDKNLCEWLELHIHSNEWQSKLTVNC